MGMESDSAGSQKRRQLQVAYVSTDPGVPIFGHKGASVHVQGVLSGLIRLGARIKLFASSVGGWRPSELDGVEIHELPCWPKGDLSGMESNVHAANEFLLSSLRENGPFDLVYERYALWSYAGMAHAENAGCPGVLEVNAPLIEEEEMYRNLKNRAFSEKVAHCVFSGASRLVAVSTGVANYLTRFPEADGKVRVIHNGVDPTRFPRHLEASLPAPPEVFTVGFVGSLKPWHGLETLVEAYALLHDGASKTRLLIVGDGPQMEKLKDELAARGLSSSSKLTGAVAPSRVPPLIASMDVGVAPYPNIRGFYFSPLKIFEYMAVGRPVVASKVGDIPDLIQEGVDGFLVPPSDPKALAATLRRLMSDRFLSVAMGSAARERVLRLYTWDAVVRKVLDLSGVTTDLRMG